MTTGIGNVLFLDVEFRRIRKMLEQSWPEHCAEQAERTARAKREAEQVAAYAKRREPEPNNAA